MTCSSHISQITCACDLGESLSSTGNQRALFRGVKTIWHRNLQFNSTLHDGGGAELTSPNHLCHLWAQFWPKTIPTLCNVGSIL